MDAAPRTRENGPVAYAAVPRKPRAINIFEQAIRRLAPYTNAWRKDVARAPNRLDLIVDLLGGEARYGAIHGWRHGRREAPQWARDRLASFLEQRAKVDLETAAALRANKKAGD